VSVKAQFMFVEHCFSKETVLLNG